MIGAKYIDEYEGFGINMNEQIYSESEEIPLSIRIRMFKEDIYGRYEILKPQKANDYYCGVEESVETEAV